MYQIYTCDKYYRFRLKPVIENCYFEDDKIGNINYQPIW